jgi:hypothetical protein
MAVMRDKWTDERLDDLKTSVDDGFRRMDDRFAKIDDRFGRVDDRLDHLGARVDSLVRATIYGAFALSSVMVAGFVAILTKL